MYDLKKACSNCPFKKEGAISLNPGRVEGIVGHLKGDDSRVFFCHKTIDAKKPKQQICFGSLVYLWKYHRLPVTARMAISLGMLDLKDIQRSEGEIIEELKDVSPKRVAKRHKP